MDAMDYNLIMKISGAVILFLLGIIGFFIKKEFSDETKKWNVQFNQMEKMIKTVAQTVDNLKSIVEIMKTEQQERDPITDKRLSEHETKLHEHSTRITRVETTCNINHHNR